MPAQLLRANEYKRQKWQNGGGVTAEIWREEGLGEEFLWRLSMADVEKDGPFSIFRGIDRHIVLVEGNGMVLDHAGSNSHRLDRHFVPHSFSGDVATNCRLINGPCRDLNLMVRRDLARSRLDIVILKPRQRMDFGIVPAFADNSELLALTLLRGALRVMDSNGRILVMQSSDTVLPGEAAPTIEPDGECVVALARIWREN